MLWVSEEGLPTSGDIPPCVCGAPRVFEFQVCFSGIICKKKKHFGRLNRCKTILELVPAHLKILILDTVLTDTYIEHSVYS